MTHLFQEALLELDIEVADQFGMSLEYLNYITSAIADDGFLKQLRPNYEHKGLRVRASSHYSPQDRYT